MDLVSGTREERRSRKAPVIFARSLRLRIPIRVQATIAADDEYELYVNGHELATVNRLASWTSTTSRSTCDRGRNTIAVRVTNRRGSTAALVARVFLREKDAGWVTYSTDETWRTNIRPFPFWNAAVYNDRFWKPAQTFGKLGDTVPWDRQEDVASTEVHRSERFRISREFEVQRVIDAEETGSLIAMAFNEFGQIVLSQEGGPLLLAVDSDKDDIVDTLRVYCESVKNVQGILPLNGQVYVTGDGPEGNGSTACRTRIVTASWRDAGCCSSLRARWASTVRTA